MRSEHGADPEPGDEQGPPAPSVAGDRPAEVYSDEEAELIAERLAALGYIE